MPYNLYIYIPRVSSIQYTVSLQAHIAPATLPTYLRYWPRCTRGDVHASLATVWMSATAYLVCQVEGRRAADLVFSAHEERTNARVMIEAMQSTTSHHPRVAEDVRLGSSVILLGTS